MDDPTQREAYELARKRIAAARSRGALALNLSPTTVELDGAEYPGDKHFEQLTELPPEIAQVTALQGLYLDNTRVTDIAPLARLSALTTLWLGNTQVADIAPLAELSMLERLTLDGTQVVDLTPIARMTSLRVVWFARTPACETDPKLAKLAEIEDGEERTRQTLAYLRGHEPNARVTKRAMPRQSGSRVAGSSPPPDEVRLVQKALAEAGFEPGPADGVAGRATQHALQAALDQSGIKGRGDLWHDFNNLKDFLENLKKPAPKPKTPPLEPELPPRPDETAPFYSDRPATQDLLNRRAVAETLGTIVDEVWKEAREEEKANPGGPARDRTFIVHLHGRWGSGKTSILNFLREVLFSGEIAKREPRVHHHEQAPEPPWVVVDYNAWRNQNLGPAWWTLMDTVYRDAADQLAGRDDHAGWKIWLNHLSWRFRSGYVPLAIKLGVAVMAAFLLLGFKFDDAFWNLVKNVISVLGFIGTFFLFKAETELLNSRTAKRYQELAHDPLGPLTERFEALIREIGRPVAVFIDDLDRCDARFVVDLLQHIQTLFRHAPVFYVVAADRGWICTSYEQVYAPYCAPIAEPGHSLGNMFLEKIFQLSVEVPSLAGAQRDAFWDHLIQMRYKEVTREDEEAIEAEVTEKLQRATKEAEIIEILDEEAKRSPERAAIAGAAAFKRMQSKELVAEREHFLAQYAPLLDANPRAMKRLLNAYGFRRGFDIQSRERAERDALVRWTILENRWPILADHLAGRSAGRADGAAMDVLMQRPEVRAVAKGLTEAKLAPIVEQVVAERLKLITGSARKRPPAQVPKAR